MFLLPVWSFLANLICWGRGRGCSNWGPKSGKGDGICFLLIAYNKISSPATGKYSWRNNTPAWTDAIVLCKPIWFPNCSAFLTIPCLSNCPKICWRTGWHRLKWINKYKKERKGGKSAALRFLICEIRITKSLYSVPGQCLGQREGLFGHDFSSDWGVLLYGRETSFAFKGLTRGGGKALVIPHKGLIDKGLWFLFESTFYQGARLWSWFFVQSCLLWFLEEEKKKRTKKIKKKQKAYYLYD